MTQTSLTEEIVQDGPFYLSLFVIFKMCQKTSLLLFDFEKAFDSLILTGRTWKILNSFLSTALSITFLFFLDCLPSLGLSSPLVDGWTLGRTDSLSVILCIRKFTYRKIYFDDTEVLRFVVLIGNGLNLFRLGFKRKFNIRRKIENLKKIWMTKVE